MDQASGKISVWNDGAGIPIQMHKEHHIYVPELIFGNLLTGSNFDDDQKKTTGGRNGFGAKVPCDEQVREHEWTHIILIFSRVYPDVWCCCCFCCCRCCLGGLRKYYERCVYTEYSGVYVFSSRYWILSFAPLTPILQYD